MIISTYLILNNDLGCESLLLNLNGKEKTILFRREFPYYKVKLIGADKLQRNKVEELGFKVF